MKVVVLGAGGIIGQNMRLNKPRDIDAIFCRSKADDFHEGIDISDEAELFDFLSKHKPDAIINLAGESRTDVVDSDASKSFTVNVEAVGWIAEWCSDNDARLVHVSSQAVFDGEYPPYYSGSSRFPINSYGLQKKESEERAFDFTVDTVIARVTFVLGVRPFQSYGRENPVEQILSGKYKLQVGDRFFSVSFAWDVAEELWNMATKRHTNYITHLGVPERVSRYQLAKMLGADVEAVSHDYFKGIAPRPRDTSWRWDAVYKDSILTGLQRCKKQWNSLNSKEQKN
jgi:dTDP-4-dehydrorhamnose reductase